MADDIDDDVPAPGEAVAAGTKNGQALAEDPHSHIAGLVRLVLNFPAQCERVVEDVSVEGNLAVRRVSFTIALPLGNDDARFQIQPGPVRRFVVPTLLLPRGQALAPVRIKTSGGELLTPLASREARLRLAQVVEAAVRERLGRDDVDVAAERVEAIALHLRRVATQSGTEADRIMKEVFGPAASAEVPSGFRVEDAPAFRALRSDEGVHRLASLVAKYYFVMVDYVGCPGDRLMLTVTYTRPLIERDYKGRRWDRLRRLAGTEAYRFRFPLALAQRTQSYHFVMTGPERHFVREQSIRHITVSENEAGGHTDAALTPLPATLPEGSHIGRPSSAGRRAHLFLADADTAQLGKIYARIVFYEQAPGQQCVAAMLAALHACVLAVITWSLGDLVAQRLNVDVAALLLAVPGALSAWAYPRSSSHGVYQTPIRARITLLWTTVASIATTLSYLRLASWSISEPSWFTYLIWTSFVALDIILAAWCIKGMRWNQSCYDEAAAYRYDKSDFFTADDYGTLVKWDTTGKGVRRGRN